MSYNKMIQLQLNWSESCCSLLLCAVKDLMVENKVIHVKKKWCMLMKLTFI